DDRRIPARLARQRWRSRTEDDRAISPARRAAERTASRRNPVAEAAAGSGARLACDLTQKRRQEWPAAVGTDRRACAPRPTSWLRAGAAPGNRRSQSRPTSAAAKAAAWR